MMRLGYGVFLVLHGAVHLLYLGQALRVFELEPGLAWPDESWLLSKLVGETQVRQTASAMLVIAALCFVFAGFGAIANQAWMGMITLVAAAFSSLIYVAFWDGSFVQLSGKGAIGILINIAIVIYVLVSPVRTLVK